MMLTCIHSKRLFFYFIFFLQWDISILCLSIILKSCTIEKSFIFVHRSPFVNIALWLFRQHDKLYVLKFCLSLSFLSPSSLCCAILLLFPTLFFHLYLVFKLLHSLLQQGIVSLCLSQPLFDVLVCRDQGKVGGDRFVTGTHRHRTLSSSGVGCLMFKDANVIIHCWGIHTYTGHILRQIEDLGDTWRTSLNILYLCEEKQSQTILDLLSY